MEWVVERKYKKEEYTVGRFYVNGELFCNSLEDKDRGLDQNMTLSQLKKMKVYSQTAIPIGRYKVVSYYWAKHQKVYPMLLNVPAYTGILIHGGTSHKDTLGCILVGENKVKGGLIKCEPYVRKLTQMLLECEKRGEETYITIK